MQNWRTRELHRNVRLPDSTTFIGRFISTLLDLTTQAAAVLPRLQGHSSLPVGFAVIMIVLRSTHLISTRVASGLDVVEFMTVARAIGADPVVLLSALTF